MRWYIINYRYKINIYKGVQTMKIKVTDLKLGKWCIQDTKGLKNKSESSFLVYLEIKKQENVLDYEIISN
jgi:hypothetical protein